jgi:poly(glycerol-phosphate) alpha-glucosyltransferase
METDRLTSHTLPHGRQLAVTWSIPDPFGGMTAALLQRSRAFVRETGTPVDIVTFDPRPVRSDLVRQLRERGDIIDGMRLWNVWEHSSTVPAGASASIATDPSAEPSSAPAEVWGDAATVRVWRTAGAPVRLAHRDADGGLRLVDERARAIGPRRLITAFGPDGSPTRQWTSAWAFYAEALDELLGGEPAFAIVDSKTVARFFQTYRRPNVASIHVVHGSHLQRTSAQRLSRARGHTLESARDWDAIVFLTERQRQDVARFLGDSGNLAVIPNALSVASEPLPSTRDPHRGVIVANLTARKRVDHALAAIAAARAAGAPLTVDIVGGGGERMRLEALARELGLDDVVRFTGHDPQAAARYRSASWTLLTSTAEGAPLVLTEAMAGGCIPVAYDIRYGPADTIDDGRSGFLVADGDIAGAAAALVTLCELGEDERTAMRAQARATALQHSDARLVARWAEVQRAALRRRDARGLLQAAVTRVRVRLLNGRYRVSATLDPWPPGARVDVELRSAALELPVRVPLRRIGRFGLARLSTAQSAHLGLGPARTRFIVRNDDAQIVVDAGRQHPDRRPLPDRAAQRVRRLLTA